jgi:tetratricopeptide (TPR) repeat protein
MRSTIQTKTVGQTSKVALTGAVALMSALLLAPAWADAQAVISEGGIKSGDPIAGGMAAGPFNPEFGPNAQDAPKESTLSVGVYDWRVEYARGFVDLQAGKFHEAEGEFRHVLKVRPNDMRSLFMLGMARSGEGDLKGALAAFEKALKVDSEQIAVRREYAVTLARLARTDKAQAELGMLKLRADACGGSCAQVDEFRTAVARVKAAISSATDMAPPPK